MANWLSLDFWRDHLLAASYTLWGTMLFFTVVIGSFPYQDALSGALGPLGLKLSYQEQHLHFPFGTELRNVRLVRAIQPAGAPLMESETVKVVPALTTILGRPGLRLNVDAYDGTMMVRLHRRRDGAIQADLDFHDLNLESYRLLSQSGAALAGRLNGNGTVKVNAANAMSAIGDMDLSIKNVGLKLGMGFPPITLNDLVGKFKVEQGLLRIVELKGNGPDVVLSGAGTIQLMPEFKNSVLHLVLHLDPTPAGRAHLGLLFGLLPHPPNSRPYLVHGTFVSPELG